MRHVEEIKRSDGTWENAATGEIEHTTFIKTLPDGGEMKSYAYDKSKRYTVSKGTRCVFVARYLAPYESHSFVGRNNATSAVIAEAAAAWSARWGEIPWDLASMLVTHVTAQVVVEFRVEPR